MTSTTLPFSERSRDVAAARYLQVSAAVRYWEDARLDNEEDVDGLVPFRVGDLWEPLIDIVDGRVVDWPVGLSARIHYKVCDAGEYWLVDDRRHRIAQWKGAYVPNDFLCTRDGWGDYIIFNVLPDGSIQDWKRPSVDPDHWTLI